MSQRKREEKLLKAIKNEVIKAIVKKLLADGWTIKSKNRHMKLFNESTNQTIAVPLTPSDSRSALNWISQIRRYGVVIPC